jgi:hypothetical protein
VYMRFDVTHVFLPHISQQGDRYAVIVHMLVLRDALREQTTGNVGNVGTITVSLFRMHKRFGLTAKRVLEKIIPIAIKMIKGLQKQSSPRNAPKASRIVDNTSRRNARWLFFRHRQTLIHGRTVVRTGGPARRQRRKYDIGDRIRVQDAFAGRRSLRDSQKTVGYQEHPSAVTRARFSINSFRVPFINIPTLVMCIFQIFKKHNLYELVC